MPEHMLDPIPLSVLALATVVVVFAALELGFRAGQWRRDRTSAEHDGTLSGVVAATLGLLALLAFSFDMAAKRFEERQRVLLEEVNSIDDAFLARI